MAEDKRRRLWSNHLKQYKIGGSNRYSSRPTIPNGFDYVHPNFYDCAHVVFDCGKSTFIYLGPKQAASKEAYRHLINSNIGSIVNCTNRIDCYHRPAIKYCQIPINDVEGADILTYLPGATTFLHAMLTTTSVLVHCEMGMSRSATVVIAYLMRFHGMSRDEAYIFCKKGRPLVNPNPGFWEQLKKFELWLAEEQKDNLEPSSTINPEEGTKMLLDAIWAQQSSASYSTCIEIPQHMMFDEICWKIFLDQERDIVADPSHILFVCLDFIWGRGVLTADLKWFAFICQRLERTRQSVRSSFSNHVNTIFEHANKMLTSPDSEFSQFWSGEVYEEQIQKYRQAMDKAIEDLS